MEDTSKISDLLLDMENELSTLQEATIKIDKAKETTVLAVENTEKIQKAVDIVMRQMIILVRSFQELDIASKMTQIESSINILETDLKQTTKSIISLDAATEERMKQQTAVLEDRFVENINQLGKKIENENKTNLNKIFAEMHSIQKKHNRFQIAQLILSLVIIVLIITALI